MTPLKPLFLGKRGNMGGVMFLGVILFNIIMYIFIRCANADAMLADNPIGDYDDAKISDINATTDQDLSTGSITSWYDGFDVTVFGMPWWVNIFYVTFQATLLGLAIYMLIRGLN